MKTLYGALFVLAFFPQYSVAEGEPSDQAGIPVTTVRVTKGDIQRVTHVQALVESLNAPSINSKVSAEVIEILVDEGDRVHRGQLLARLDDEGFRLDKEAAQADIARLQVILANQRLTLNRDEQLFKKGLVPDTRLDASRTAVKQTRASIVHARALLKKAEYQLSHATITAPLDGVIQQRLVSVGDYLNPMSPASKALFQIVDDRHLRARLYFPERLAGVVHEGMPVTLNRDGQTLHTRISHLRPMVEEASRSFVALADFENSHHWPPGARISADVVLEEHHDALLIPEAVLVQRPAGLSVYRLHDGQVEALSPALGMHQEGRVEVLSGLTEGDRLVLDGVSYLTNGIKVSVTEDDSGSEK